ncbi:GDP-mannose 4,6-dehydratase [Usitatibacter palustris]|uniref:GDP-mannose 4,6-dehydratase n=1 Tax=Usitatibacter palustris TaxID=2732487 RepID=A0A6M4HA98_9PROT|nr:GDP-mannose 4,6-dehydratase [Usitatibacter palustris]QJR16486.1 GDP-mannose 4,6-dehydratase [Usitatibacter palustris]
MKRALITGITGQDGSFLAELLLDKGYRIFGFARRESWLRPNNASHLADRIEVLFGNMAEGVDISSAVQAARPDEIYNLASQSRPGLSWDTPAETLVVNGLGAVRLFDAVRHNSPQCRVYHASSSEMFGPSAGGPQDEDSAFMPVNPYAAAKVYAHQVARIYREGYGLFIVNGLLFNHESERRPLHFVTQKIAYGAACRALGIVDSPDLDEMGLPIVREGKLRLGNLEVSRDWGYAGDFVRAMWLMLQQERPEDYVIGTGKLHSLRELCEVAYRTVGADWRDNVVSEPRLVRPLDAGCTLADASRSRARLGWEPTVSFEEMVTRMVKAQVDRLRAAATHG